MPTTRRAFYLEWLRRSFWGPVGLAQAISFVFFIVFGLWAFAFPEMQVTLNLWLLGISAGSFLSFFTLGWWLAPYVMYRELEERADKLQTKCDSASWWNPEDGVT